MKTRILKALLIWTTAASGLGGLLACGGDKGSGDSTTPVTSAAGATGKGFITTATGTTATLDFSASPANSQYILMPFVLGAITAHDGSDKARTIEFDISKGAAAAPAGLTARRRTIETPLMDPVAAAFSRDLDLRSLAGHFDASRGANQIKGFWELARSIDAAEPKSAFLVEEQPGAIEGYYLNAVKQKQRSKRKATLAMSLTPATCPTTQVLVPASAAQGDTDKDTIPTGMTVDGGSFCIVYLSTPVSEPDTAAIKASITTILSSYKTNIYNDTFPDLTSGFTFKPTYVVVDVSNTNLWPTGAALNLAGVYRPDTSKTAGLPMIYIAADFTKVTTFGNIDPALLKRQFHSVLAHETQHAILDYYRGQSGGAEEPIDIDEGLAHYMEDLFGYGDDSFAFWAKPFLDIFGTGTSPFLVGSSDYGVTTSAAISRSVAHTLFYYLSSQKGGVEFTSGLPSGGGGLSFVVNYVKSKTAAGPQNIANVFGADLPTTMGNFVGALAIDNLTLPDPTDDIYKVKDPQPVVNDLTGGTGKNYGMHFNNYLSIADHTPQYANGATETKLDSLSYYMTAPVLYTVADPTQKYIFTVTAGDSANFAVSAVRIK